MKRVVLFLLIASVLFFTSCGGATVGAVLGGALGSAIGGIGGGPRGSDVGLLVGAVGGAMVGAAMETAADNQQAKQQADDQRKYQEEKAHLAANRDARLVRSNTAPVTTYDNDNSAYYDPSSSGDDRVDIDFGDEEGYPESVTVEEIDDVYSGPQIEIRNVRFIDKDGTNTISRGEQCRIVFEIYNCGNSTAYDIEPSVVENTPNSHIQISPSILIESLAANKGVRYTARLLADNSLKDGTAYFTITVTVDGQEAGNGVTFSIPTSRN